ncbi:hypothetical protein QQX98_008897 [Neonectria punicea]|uniref:NADP-dependent oxidoreductase domain-containing protein n=1 Tax=Neonectria punicea TaxID=979145 RepID=A0ABR1GV33_9HYPO
MDPINAFQVAAAAIGLVDFGARLLSDSYEIYQSASGRTARDVELATLSGDLSELSKQVQSHLKDGSHVSSRSESALLSLSARCIEASDKLQTGINDLQAGKHGKGKVSTAANSFASALKAVWKRSEIEGLKEDLLEIRSQIVFTSLISIWDETRQDRQRHGDVMGRLDQISQKLDRSDGTARLFAKELAEMTIHENSSHLTRKNADLVNILWGIDWKSWAAVQGTGLFGSPKTAKANDNDLPISIKILSSLSFHGMDARQESIPEAYTTTFNWIFQNELSNTDGKILGWPSFPEWLQAKDDSIYWITGKPGSGKSTLMKYIFENPRLEDHLQDYAGDLPLMLAGFFFWNPGSEMEKSQEGLLRTLLHQVLRERPDLIPIVAPRRWALFGLLDSDVSPPGWTWRELKESFDTLCHYHRMEFSLVVFIDGLDEFSEAEKSPGTLINWIEDIITHHHVKVCVSSRPWNVFSDAFSKGPSLTMQSLTRRDIQHFVNSEFEKSPAFQDLWDVFDDEAVSLLEEITEKADGVFLWVSLVVKSLLFILVDTPSLPHLHKKLADIPSDIIGMYTSIWHSIPPERLATASKVFQICRAAIDGLHVEVCWLATEGVSTPNLIKNPKARRGIPKVMKRVLEGYTRGICELSNDEVRFLHRSTLEWMRERTIWAEICSKAPHEFESNLSLLEASIQHIPVEQDFQIIHDADLLVRFSFARLSALFFYASLAYASPACQSNRSRKHRVTVALDEINKIVCERFMELIHHEDSNSGSVAESMDQNLEMFSAVNWVAGELSADLMDIELSFVGTAARAGLVDYVKEKVAHDKRLLVPKRRRASILEQAIFKDVELLVDPNSRFVRLQLRLHNRREEERMEIIRFILDSSKTRYYTALGEPIERAKSLEETESKDKTDDEETPSTMPLQTHFTLNTGATIPAVGFGTWQAPPGQVEKAVENALNSGYRHIDCAAIYRNEAEVGEGIRKSGVERSEIFITGKLWNTKHAPEDVEKGLDKSLKDLGTDYLDLFLMHWPIAFKAGDNWFPVDLDGTFEVLDIDPGATYTAMEKLLQTGKVRAIGVSNFNKNRLEDLLSKTKVVPAVNQIEAHPYLQQHDLFEFCKEKGIQLAAYSPLGNNQTGEARTVDDPLVAELGKKLGLDIGQVLCSWGVQRGTVVLSKSVTARRIESNIQVKELPQDAFDQLNALERHKRYHWMTRWGVDIFQELGDEEVKRVARELGPDNLEKFGK